MSTEVVLVSRHVPRPQGTAAGRALFALGAGLVSMGVPLTVHSWDPDANGDDLPAWCRHHDLAPEPRWRATARSVLHPVHEVVRSGLGPFDPGAVVVADDPPSFPAVASHPEATVTVHYSTALDRRAVAGRPTLREIQLERAERAAVRSATRVLAYSPRVAAATGQGAIAVPIATPVPTETPPVPDAPRAAVVGTWSWGPNRVALEVLLRAWPDVRRSVPGAVLTVAGPGSEAVAGPGVKGLGRVADPAEVLAAAAVVPFPCPPSSGPKVKALEALAHGRILVTTVHGVEGIWADGPVARICREADVAAELIGVLSEPLAAADLATAGRAAVLAHHAPHAAARHRVAALGIDLPPQEPTGTSTS